jgi:hypothetical protein
LLRSGNFAERWLFSILYVGHQQKNKTFMYARSVAQPKNQAQRQRQLSPQATAPHLWQEDMLFQKRN